MKKVLFRLVLFAVPMLLLWSCLEAFYRIVPNNYTQKQDYLQTHSNQIETLLFGDSHCFYGLNPDYFDSKTFNYSNVSQTIYFDQLLLEKYLPQLPKLKQVVFCIEYTNLSQQDNTQDDVWRKYYYQYYMNLNVPIVSNWSPKKYSLALTQPLDRNLNLVVKYYKIGTILDCNPNGWGNNYLKKDRIEPQLVSKQRAQAQEDGSTDFSLNLSRLQQCIDACKARNIKVLIVSMPQTQLYTSYLNPKKLKAIYKSCRQLAILNPNNVRYLNLFEDRRFEDQDFYDSDHLNEVGAAKCSRVVNVALQKSW